jgi:hypothetical protein
VHPIHVIRPGDTRFARRGERSFIASRLARLARVPTAVKIFVDVVPRSLRNWAALESPRLTLCKRELGTASRSGMFVDGVPRLAVPTPDSAT